VLDAADVVVIGAGARGSAVAYYLAREGIDVALVDRGFIAVGTTGATVALINVSGKPPAEYTALSLASARLYSDLGAELGIDLQFESGQSLFRVVLHPADLPAAREYAARQSRVPGVEIRVLDAYEARQFAPELSPDIAGALYCPQDGHLNPFRLAWGFVVAARRLGARFHHHTRVVGIRTTQSQITSVVTTAGEIGTRTVVNAAGVEVPTLGEMVGLSIPLVASRGQVVTTEALPPLFPGPIDSMRQTKAGPVLIGTTDEFVGYDTGVTPEALRQNVRRAMRIIPRLRTARAIRCWAGLRPWPIDGLPIMGRGGGLDGYVIAAGHSGITLSAITGRLTTDAILGRDTAVLEPFGLSRFSEGRFHFPMESFKEFRRRHVGDGRPHVAAAAADEARAVPARHHRL
jgi:glycine/D-amino acid oxidase-like deaminating enzyme